MAHTTKSADDKPNPYEASGVKSDGTSGDSSFRMSVTFVFAVVLSGGLFLAVLFTQSRIESRFLDFGVELPFATICALSPWTLGVAGALFLFTVAKEFIGIDTRLVRLCNGLACLAALILGLIYAAAIFLPLIYISTTLSS